jgi:hypothetical protein
MGPNLSSEIQDPKKLAGAFIQRYYSYSNRNFKTLPFQPQFFEQIHARKNPKHKLVKFPLFFRYSLYKRDFSHQFSKNLNILIDSLFSKISCCPMRQEICGKSLLLVSIIKPFKC